MKPIFLFADSQLLFWRHDDTLFIERLREEIDRDAPRAAYIGASNDDKPEYYGIFEAAMEGIGIDDTRLIPSDGSAEERSFLAEADLVLLAGGDALHGWRVLERNGMRDVVARRYYEGAVLCGVSAGAIQLGCAAYGRENDGSMTIAAGFRFVPCVIGAHDERGGWTMLEEAVGQVEPRVRGVGIPTGGGLVFHSDDNSIEPIRHPLHERSLSDGKIEERLLFPSAAS